MHGLPQQSVNEAKNDLTIGINLGINHISWYQLTIEPNTEFYSRPPALPCADELAEIYDSGMTLLTMKILSNMKYLHLPITGKCLCIT